MIGLLRWVMLTAALLSAGLAAPAQAERRVALVLGNGDYTVEQLKLANPGNDAEAIAKTLQDLGFEVTKGIDLDYEATLAILRKFRKDLEDAQVALFYYAGHGVQIDGENYFLPIDNVLATREDLNRALSLSRMQTLLEQDLRINLIFIDACRDNPLAARLEAAPAPSRTVSRSGTRGLAAVDMRNGTLIVFATDPGKVALDGNDGHSPFTRALVRHLPTPDLEISDLIRKVQYDVQAATRGTQRPWALSSLLTDFYLKASPAVATLPDSEAVAWERAAKSNDAQPLITYLRMYPKGRFINEARERLRMLPQSGERAPDVLTAADRLDLAAAKLAAAMPEIGRLITGGFTYAGTRIPTPCGRELAKEVGAALGGNVVMARAAEALVREGEAERGRAPGNGPLRLPEAADVWLLEGQYAIADGKIELAFELQGRAGRFTSDRLRLVPAYGSPCRDAQPPEPIPLTTDLQRGALKLELASPRGGSPVYTITKPPEHMELSLRLSGPAHLYCFERDAQKRIQMLLPNRYRPDSEVRGGSMLLLPTDIKPTQPGNIFAWAVTEPGVTVIKCFATEQDVRLPPSVLDVSRSPSQIAGLDDLGLLRLFREGVVGQLAEASVVASFLPEE